MQLGHRVFSNGFQILWGGQNASMDNLQSRFPELTLVKLKQTHSDICRQHTANSSAHGFQGDALISNEPGVALAVSTADCLPVMVTQPSTGWFGGIHSGWKGVALGIVPKTLAALTKSSGKKDDLHIWIGPHIQMASFEVGADVREQILSSLKNRENDAQFVQELGGGKSLLNLAAIVTAQIQEAGLQPASLSISSEDTKTSHFYHSHRRDKEKSGRQNSLIFKKC